MKKLFAFISIASLVASLVACDGEEYSKNPMTEQPSADVPSVGAPTVDFISIDSVFAHVPATDTVVFLIRHAERGADYSPMGLLTPYGKVQAQRVGEKIKNGEAAFYAHSDYARTQQTCESIAIGRGDDPFVHEEWAILTGDWYRRSTYPVSWEMVSKWAYLGGYENWFYNLDERSEEWLDSLKAHLPSMKRVNVLVSHDLMVLAMAVYATSGQIDLRYWENGRWINYLAGVAIIYDPNGNMTLKLVRGLDSGVMVKG